MESHTPLTEQEGLRFVTEMMHKGRRSLHDSGTLVILWGIVNSFCSLISSAQMKGMITLPFNIWFLPLLAVIPSVFISIRQSKKKVVKHYEDDVLNFVWICFGVSLGLVSFVNGVIYLAMSDMLVQMQQKGIEILPSYRFWNYAGCYFLIIYGLPTFVPGATKKFMAMMLGGIVCWVFTILAAFTALEVDLLPMAIAAIVSWLNPGFIFWQQMKPAPKAVEDRHV